MNKIDKFIEEHTNKHLCACGCGSYIVIKRHHYSDGIPKFIQGHHSRVNNPFKGKHHTEEYKNNRCDDGNPHWHGGKYIDSGGYIRVLSKDHKDSDTKGYIKEHRLIWMEHNGDIPDGFCIHHINGNKTDNRIKNLQLLPIPEHNAIGKKGNEYARKYSDRTVLEWVELHRYDKLSYTKISKKTGIDRDVIYKNVKKFEAKFPLPEWASHQIYRESGLLENICSDNHIGHPHEKWLEIYDPHNEHGYSIHCCDGCCLLKEEIKELEEDDNESNR